MDRKLEFIRMTDRLGLPAADLAMLIGRSVTTVHQYRSFGSHSRMPPEDIVEMVRSHWRSQLRRRLETAVDDMRAAGIDIAWGQIPDRTAA